jgi:hypothetical protein
MNQIIPADAVMDSTTLPVVMPARDRFVPSERGGPPKSAKPK